jgi:hypothetical protein
MPSQRRPTLPYLIIGLFFVAGIATVLFGAEGPTQEAGGAASGEPNETVLVLGVDDLSAPSPRLVAVWHATFSAENRDLLLYGEPVDRKVCNGQSATLEELFAWDAEAGLRPEFLAAFGSSVPQAYVVADEHAFTRLIDVLEGLELNEAQLHGDQVIAVLRTLYANPIGALTTQEQFLIALSQRVAEIDSNVDLNSLTELIPAHAFSSVPPQELLTIYLRLQPLDSSSILVFAPPPADRECDG